MATGDLKNNLKKLHFELRRIRLPQHLQNTNGFASGDAMSYLPIYEYLFDWYSPSVTQCINEHNFKLLPYQQDKHKFLEMMYLVLREVFNWKPSLTIAQFLSTGFVEHKAMMCAEISRRIREMHFELEMKGPEKKPLTHGGIKMTIKNLPASFATNGKKDDKNSIGDANCTNSNFGDITSTEYDSQLTVMTMEMCQKLQDCCEEVKEMKHSLTTFEAKLQELDQKVNSLNLRTESSNNSSRHNSPTYGSS